MAHYSLWKEDFYIDMQRMVDVKFDFDGPFEMNVMYAFESEMIRLCFLPEMTRKKCLGITSMA